MTELRGKVVVITGASSGLGRATALELAGRGCCLVVTSRRLDVLESLAVECRDLGAEAIAVRADVTNESDLQRVAAAALERWQSLDVWINNAGITLYASLEEGPIEHHKRVLETNLIGCILGARAAIPIFRRSHRGVLINIGSVLSQVGQPFVPSYAVSKFGVQGVSEALRVELADEPEIHICTLFPYAIDTPHFQHAGNLIGRRPIPLQPLQSPEHVAREIARLAANPHRVRHVPRIAALGLALHALFPRTTERLLLDALRRWHFQGGLERSEGNLYSPDGETSNTHGDHKPLTTTATLMAWVAVHLAGLVTRAVGRRLRRAFEWRRAAEARRDEIAAPA